MNYDPKDLKSVVKYMESKGIYFSSDSSNLPLSSSYAIMGGKSSVRILQKAEDNVNGLVTYLFKDKEDLNRIVNRLGKEVYPNGDKTRPYKVSILDHELDTFIEIFKENELNVLKKKD